MFASVEWDEHFNRNKTNWIKIQILITRVNKVSKKMKYLEIFIRRRESCYESLHVNGIKWND